MINRWSKRLTRDAAALVSPFRSSGGGARTISAVSDSNLPAFEQADRPVQSDRRSRIAPVTSGKRRREEFGVRFQSVLCRDRNDPRVWPPTRPRRSETGSGSGTRTPRAGGRAPHRAAEIRPDPTSRRGRRSLRLRVRFRSRFRGRGIVLNKRGLLRFCV
mgnify:CR=1 FL=1